MLIRRRFALCSLSTLVALLVAGCVATSGAFAATIAVTTNADTTTVDGLCSLREAINGVNSPPGSPDCDAVTAGGANTILLGAQTYKFANGGAGEDANASGDLDVAGATTSLTISGEGAGSTIIDANHVDRVFDIHSGPAVTFEGVTITNGNAPNGSGAGGAGAPGGGILSTTALTLTDSAVTNNKAGSGNAGSAGNPGNSGGSGGNGGGINVTAALTLTDSTISGNFAGNGGSGGTGSPSNATGATGGSGGAGGLGGGVYLFGSLLTITGTTVSGNHGGNGGNGGKGGLGTNGTGTGGNGGAGTQGSAGGGVVSLGGSTTLISRSTFTGNAAGNGGTGGAGDDGTGGNGGNGGTGGGGGGGGAIGATGSLTITNSTLQGNSGGTGGTGGGGGNGNGLGNGGNGGTGGNGGQGGALITNLTTPGALTNLTIAASTAGGGGTGGVAGAGNANGSDGSAGSAGVFDDIRNLSNGVALANSVVTGGTGTPCSGNVTDGGHNVVTDNCAGIASVGDPKLAALADNGGPTQTMALQAGSAAIDAVPASGAGCPTTDERGAQRPAGAACDAGAYEVAPPVPVTGDADGLGDATATLHGTVTPNGADAEVRFEYGTTSAYGAQTEPQHLGGFSAQAVSAAISGLASGTTYHFRVIATNSDGSATGEDKTFTTTGAPGGGSNTPPGGGSQPPPGSQSGATLAAVTGLSFAPGTFRAAPKGPPATAAKARIGSKVSFTLNLAASVRFTVVKQLPGRRGRGGRCVKPTRANRKARKCTRTVAVRGSFTRTGTAGANTFRFSGRMRGHKLAPGRYRLVALPTAGGKAGKKTSAPFRIVR